MADIVTPQQRSWNMSRIKGKDTKPEIVLRSLLHRRGYRFRLHDRSLPGRPDIVLPRYRTVIFVNGCFWHRHPGCPMAYSPASRVDFWSSKFSATVARDERNEQKLRALGWHVITVWECELQKTLDATLEAVEGRLAEAV
jgi:DNA mismatch endonuclease (patch repair protein)